MRRYVLAGLLLLGFAPEADAKVVRLFVGKYGYRDPGAVFLAPAVDYGGVRAVDDRAGNTQIVSHGPQLGVQLLGISAGERDLQGQASLGYRQMNLEGLEIKQRQSIQFLEPAIGLRYFPRAPTFLLAESFCVRVTAAASAGAAISFYGDLNFPIDLAGGLHFTTGRNPHGFVVELVHRPNHFDLKYRPDTQPGDPVVPEAQYDVKAWTALRVSFFFGP